MTVEELIARAFEHDKADREREAIRYYDQAYQLGVPADIRKRFLVGYGSTLRNVGRVDDAVGVLSQAVVDYPDYPACAAFLALALLDAGHAKAAVATMLGCALDTARPGVFEGYERALTEYHQLLLEKPVA
jgi:tetratricopeptide (TPR) repeat protein